MAVAAHANARAAPTQPPVCLPTSSVLSENMLMLFSKKVLRVATKNSTWRGADSTASVSLFLLGRASGQGLAVGF